LAHVGFRVSQESRGGKENKESEGKLDVEGFKVLMACRDYEAYVARMVYKALPESQGHAAMMGKKALLAPLAHKVY
jgi:hypothetical protein